MTRLAAVVAIAALAASAGASATTPRPAAGRILFESDRAARAVHPSLYSIGVGGLHRRRLVSDVENVLSVAWSPDGRRIAFFRNGAVYVVAAGGGRPRVVGRVTGEADTTFSWSPDGTRIAFFDFTSVATLVIARVDGSLPHTRRIRMKGVTSDRPAWSPDGKRIAVTLAVTRASCLCIVDLASGRLQVLLPHTDGGDPAWSPDGRTIAFSFADNVVLADVGTRARRVLRHVGYTPSWSPDSTKLAVTVGLDDVYVVAVRTGRRVRVSRHVSTDVRTTDAVAWLPDSRRLVVPVYDDVYIVRADGRGARRVTRQGRTAALLTVPSPSPDGLRVAYVAEAKVAPGDNLFTMRPDGTDVRALTHDSGGESDPVWSPDRGRVAFVRTTGLSGEIYVSTVGAAKASAVARGFHPSWTPDGTRLAYARDGDLYSIVLAGGQEQLLAGGPTSDSEPTWSPDGTRIAFARRASAAAPADVWIAAADGTAATQVTHVGDATDSCNPREAFTPAWSPDGSDLAYVRGIGVNSTCNFHQFQMSVHTIHVDGTGDSLVTAGRAGEGGASDPVWSPDGLRLAVTLSEQADERSDVTYRIAVVGRDGRGLRVVNGPDSRDPDWR
jgi:Tol biopolymer transport system component